jgi:hypothetical protein
MVEWVGCKEADAWECRMIWLGCLNSAIEKTPPPGHPAVGDIDRSSPAKCRVSRGIRCGFHTNLERLDK